MSNTPSQEEHTGGPGQDELLRGCACQYILLASSSLSSNVLPYELTASPTRYQRYHFLEVIVASSFQSPHGANRQYNSQTESDIDEFLAQ